MGAFSVAAQQDSMKLLVFLVACFATAYGSTFDMTPDLLNMMKDYLKVHLKGLKNPYYNLNNIKVEEVSIGNAEIVVVGESITLGVDDIIVVVSAQNDDLVENVSVAYQVARTDLNGRLDADSDRLVLLGCDFEMGKSHISGNKLFAENLKEFLDVKSDIKQECFLVENSMRNYGVFDMTINELLEHILAM